MKLHHFSSTNVDIHLCTVLVVVIVPINETETCRCIYYYIGSIISCSGMSNFIKIGDIVTLRNIKVKNYLCAEGILSDDIVVGKMDSFEDNWFQICLPRQYSAAQELEEFIEVNNVDVKNAGRIDKSTLRHLEALKTGARNEQKMNEVYMKNKRGNEVRYGDSIQLLHVKSKKYVTVVGNEVAEYERQNIRVRLDPAGSPNSWLILQPRFKINQAGDAVLSNSEIKLNIAERSNEYLHCTDKGYTNGHREVNASLDPTSWLLAIFQSATDTQDTNTILHSELVSLFDPETQSALSIFQRPATIRALDGGSDVSDDDSLQDMNPDGEVVLELIDGEVSSNGLWMLESRAGTTGGPVQWKTDYVRLKHVNTGLYMCMRRGERATDNEYTLTVSRSTADRGTLLNVSELHSANAFLQNKKAVQINHKNGYLEKGGLREVASICNYKCAATTNKSNAVYLFISRYEKAEDGSGDQPLDIFVGSSLRNFMKLYLNSLEDFLEYDPEDGLARIWPGLEVANDKRFFLVMEKCIHYLRGHPISEPPPADPDAADDDAVNEFGDIIRDDVLIGRRQGMLREQGTVDAILQLLNGLLPIFRGSDQGDVDEDEVVSIERQKTVQLAQWASKPENEVHGKRKQLVKMAARTSKVLLRTLLQAIKRNGTNQLYVANHMHVVLGWVGVQPVAADVVRELLHGNFELQTEYIGKHEIKIFTNQLVSPTSHMKSMYFTMLKAFCSCSGHGISRNQGLVMEAVMPLMEQVFVHMVITATTDVDTTKEYFSSSLYLPPSSDEECSAMLGAAALTKGLPYLSLTWKCPDEALSPQSLFGTAVVPLSEIFKKHQKLNRANSRIGGAIGGIVRTQSSSSIRPGLSRSFSDLGKKKPTTPQSLQQDPARNISAERKQAVIAYFVAELSLLAEMCLDRNISAITQVEAIVPYDYLISILSGQTLSTSAVKSQASSDLYGAAANLMTTLYVDRESETTSRMPCLSKMWSQLQDQGLEVACVESNRIYRYGLLQHIISTHIRNMPSGGGTWETHSLYMVSILKKLISLNFYGTTEKLKDVIEPVMTVLNRRNPALDSKEFAHVVMEADDDEDEEEEEGAGGAVDIAKLVNKKNHTWQKKTLKFMESVTELAIVMTVVLVSTAVALVQVVQGYGGIGFQVFDSIVGFFFLVEVSLRGYVHFFVRRKWSTFFSDHFVQLDIGVVLLDIIVMGSEDALGSFGSFSGILRALRMLRLMRVVRAARLLKQLPESTDETSKWFLPTRYRTAAAHELGTMIEMVDTLRDVQRVIDDRNLNILLRGFVAWSEEIVPPEKDVPRAAAVLAAAIEESKSLTVSNDSHDDTLMDLLMYVNADLVQSVLDLLMAHHSSVSSMMVNARAVQLLVSPSRERQYKMANDLLLELDRHIERYALWSKVSNEEEMGICQRSIEILSVLRDNCRTRRTVLEFDFDYEQDKHMQNLLRNFGCWGVCLKLLRKLILSNVDENLQATKAGQNILRACCDLLYWFVYANEANQEELFEELDFFLDMIDMGIGAHTVYAAIFSGNEGLMRRVPVRHIAEMTERICKNGRFPQYLTLLSSITAVGDKNILENQYEIVKQISSPTRQKKILVFCCPTSHFEYSRKVKLMSPLLNKKDCTSEDIAAELAYHVELLKVLAGCTLGWYNITTIETKVQAMFNYIDVIDAMMDEKCPLYIKIRTGLFLYNAILEVEMLIPGLQYSLRVWELLQYCSEVLAGGKDILRQIERNGWDAPSSSRQSVEFTVVCGMIAYAFFKTYYDPVTFPREHKATYGTQASSLDMSMREIESIINRLFDYISGIYELDSPLLSVKHKSFFYGSLEYLSKAKGIVLSDFIQNTHSDTTVSEITQAMQSLTNVNHMEEKAAQKLNHFLDCLGKDKSFDDLCKEEYASVIRKISSLPLASDTTSTSTVRYEPFLKKLVDHIRSGTKIITHSTGREKHMSERRTKTAIWIIKLFRTMIEDVWGMSIYERDDEGGEEQDIASAAIVHTFNTCGATTLCVDLIAAGINRELVLECINLCVAMLFKEGGALAVQQTMYHHLSNTDSDLFFLQLRKIMTELISWHDWSGVTTLEEGVDPDLPADIIAVRFMQLMCEGHYCPNQDILREQPDKLVSVNLLDDMVSYLVCVGRIPCRTSTAAALAVGATVLEVIQGPCEGNQDHFALNTSLLETLNHQMRARVSGDCDEAMEIELKKTGIDIFQALLEGQGQKTAVYERVLSVIHLDVIQLMCTPPEEPDEDSDEAGKVQEEVDEEVEEISRLLRTESLVLLQMLCDFRPSLRSELEVLSKGDGIGGESVACVEIMWRGELQRRFFNIPIICQDFTESAKSSFVEYVDRSSQENKHLDMYRRAKVIYTDLLHQKFLREIHLNKVFSRHNQNRATWVTFILCLVINLLMLFYYDGSKCLDIDIDSIYVNDTAVGDELPFDCGVPDLPYTIRESVDILNIIQIVFSSFTLLLFLIVRAPVHYLTAMKNGKGVLMAVVETALDPLTLYYFVYVILATLSINIDHILTLLLLDIVVKNSYAMDVLIAIFTPIKQLAMAMLLCIIVMYIFAMVVVSCSSYPLLVFASFRVLYCNSSSNSTLLELWHTLTIAALSGSASSSVCPTGAQAISERTCTSASRTTSGSSPLPLTLPFASCYSMSCEVLQWIHFRNSELPSWRGFKIPSRLVSYVALTNKSLIGTSRARGSRCTSRKSTTCGTICTSLYISGSRIRTMTMASSSMSGDLLTRTTSAGCL